MPIICQFYGSYTDQLAREGGGSSKRDAFSHHSKEGGTHTEVSLQKHPAPSSFRAICQMDGMGRKVTIGHWSSKSTYSANKITCSR